MNKTKQNRVEKLDMWNDVTGTVYCFGYKFKNNSQVGKKLYYIKYSTRLSKKDESGEYENFYITVQFKKEDDPEIEGAFSFNLLKGFLTFDTFDTKTEKGKQALKLVVMDFDELSENNA